MGISITFMHFAKAAAFIPVDSLKGVCYRGMNEGKLCYAEQGEASFN
jgi:hypothetical protein